MKLNVAFAVIMGFLALGAFAGELKPKLHPADKSGLMAEVKIPDGFTATLFAAPPDCGYPTCLTCAPDGEVLVGVDENGSLGHDPNRGRILRCIDTDGDGKADKFVVFAKIDSPRGLVHTGKKLFCLNPPFLTVYNINFDGTAAGEPEVLVKGMGGGRTHPRGADHTTNGIQIGIDGWIYIAAGDFGFFKAVDKSGKELEFHGGGIARVRQDGTDLEIVSQGQRNIYDVAISPLMEIFTRDNTNDGDGWDVRLSHVIPGANYGYPSLYKSFGDEMIQPLADYGGGSPCGSLYLDEPGFPDGLGRGLYTCEWGVSKVHFHPLEQNGASFKDHLAQIPIVEIPRATDMEVDGQGHLYISSWRNGGFSFSKPDVGFVARLSVTDAKPEPFPNLDQAFERDLLKYIVSPSHFCRIHTQHEMQRRGPKPELIFGLQKILNSDRPLPVRVAVMYTLKLLQGAQANDTLIRLAANPEMKEYALKALADRKSEAKDVPSKIFIDALTDANPRVRLQAAYALTRLERKDAAEAMIPLLADADYAIAHIAFRGLAALNAGDECLQALDKSPTTAPGILKTLMYIHDPKVVDGLIERAGKAQDPVMKQGILRALCRLYYKEAPWDGSWWSTRPDSSGPYFKTVTWEASDKILATLKAALSSSDPATVRSLAMDLQKNKIDMPEAMALLLKSAETDPGAKPGIVAMLAARNNVPPEAQGLLEGVATNDKEDAGLRLKAFTALQKMGGDKAQDAIVHALVTFGAGDKPAGELLRAREDFARDGKRNGQIPYFTKLAESEKPEQRELAYGVLLQIVANKQAKKDQKDAAHAAIDSGFGKPGAASLLHAIGHARSDGFAEQIREKLKDGNADIASAAQYAAKQCRVSGAGAAAGPVAPIIKTMTYEQVVEKALTVKGDVKIGSELFLKQRCVACHTVSPTETPKGPFLGDIAVRYKRPEILESVLKPSAKIAQGFQTVLIKMKDGKRYEGFISKEAEEIELRNSAGETVLLPAKDVDTRKKLETSVMPEGIVENLTIEEFGHLLAYLESLKNAK